MKAPHFSVMRDETLEYLAPKAGKIYVDGTFGAGGHSRAILEAAECKLYAIDRDPDAKTFAAPLLEEFPQRFQLLQGNYSDMQQLLATIGVTHVDGILLDIGVSSMQLDRAERGFSFSKDAPLDMRMSQEGKDATSLVNETEEEELANIIYLYGGERLSRRIAKAIVTARSEEPITRTVQLAEIIRKAVGRYNDTIDPATRSFQAIRIWVNDELGELERGLAAAERLLNPGGRLVVISFHSLEDGIVKQFFKTRSGHKEQVSRYLPERPNDNSPDASFTTLTRKSVKASDAELKRNIRSRSAHLRAAERTTAPAWGGVA